MPRNYRSEAGGAVSDDLVVTSESPEQGSSKSRKKDKPIAPNTYRLGYLIHDVSRMRRTLLDQHMKPEGITRSQWWVLANLSRHDHEGVMTTELARMLDVGKVALGGLINRLEIGGYVYRRPDKTDRRAKKVFITAAGYLLIERMREIVGNLNNRMSEALSEKEIASTERNLIQLKDTLRDMLGEIRSDHDGLADADDDDV